jgi:hypothetical protein
MAVSSCARTPTPGAATPAHGSSRTRQVGGLPTGRLVGLQVAGPLAVGSTGARFVVDQRGDRVLVREPDGRFGVVAGTGQSGYSGDGGPAIKAELFQVSDIAVGPDGSLYLADGGRVRSVSREGVIQTVAGDGGPSTVVADGTPALDAALGSVNSIAFGPGGQLYIATESQLLRLTSAGALDTIPAMASKPTPGILGSFGQIAVDGLGNIYVSSGYAGWGLYKVSPDGTSTFLGQARRSGGNLADVENGPNGTIEADEGAGIVQIEGNQLVDRFVFNDVHGIRAFWALVYFAYAPNGTLYADDQWHSAFQPYQQIVAVTDGRGTSLWQHRNSV